jgi:putative transposase
MRKSRFTEAQIIGVLHEHEAHRIKALEEENRQLKRIVADQALNLQVMKDLLGKQW